jgi:hypothetical protein
LESVINGPSAYGVSTQVLAHVIRVCTHPRIFARPSPISEQEQSGEPILGREFLLQTVRLYGSPQAAIVEHLRQSVSTFVPELRDNYLSGNSPEGPLQA